MWWAWTDSRDLCRYHKEWTVRKGLCNSSSTTSTCILVKLYLSHVIFHYCLEFVCTIMTSSGKHQVSDNMEECEYYLCWVTHCAACHCRRCLRWRRRGAGPLHGAWLCRQRQQGRCRQAAICMGSLSHRTAQSKSVERELNKAIHHTWAIVSTPLTYC